MSHHSQPQIGHVRWKICKPVVHCLSTVHLLVVPTDFADIISVEKVTNCGSQLRCFHSCIICIGIGYVENQLYGLVETAGVTA